LGVQASRGAFPAKSDMNFGLQRFLMNLQVQKWSLSFSKIGFEIYSRLQLKVQIRLSAGF
jgi:hypothetical protein